MWLSEAHFDPVVFGFHARIFPVAFYAPIHKVIVHRLPVAQQVATAKFLMQRHKENQKASRVSSLSVRPSTLTDHPYMMVNGERTVRAVGSSSIVVVGKVDGMAGTTTSRHHDQETHPDPL